MLEQARLKPGHDYIGIGVGAVVLEQESILLIQRLKALEAGHWGIQGGAVEFGETIEAAVQREVHEELGVSSQIVTMLGVVNHILPEEGVYWVSPVFLVELKGKPFNAEPTKHADLRWFPVRNLPQPLTLATRQVLQLLR